ncbi:M48 family metalloprotease [Flavisericum labens]|uniref:M48 family metalloprotease n=1 Tax=Flavisericum labens TaxID=3377112 RepID=UPI00387B1ED1
MKYFYCCVFLCSYFACFSQNHQLIDTTDYDKRKLLISKIEGENEIFTKEIKSSYKGKLRKEVLSFYEESQNRFLELIKNKKFLFQERFENYSDSLFSTLAQNNPIVKEKKISLFLAKTPSPNAFSIGNGSIILNVGLFSFLDNEQQLLSIMAHEAAHEVLQHTKRSIESKAKLNISVLAKNSGLYRSIKAEKFNRGSRSFDMLKNLLYEDGEKQRKNEVEADSLGYLLYKNTGASKTEYINALLKLKKYDSVPAIVLDSATYKKVFDLPEQPFKKAWTEREDFGVYNYDNYKEKIDLDSIQDHPEVQQRIDKLQSTFPELNDSNIHITVNNTFKDLKRIANLAYAENLFYLNEYGLSTYLILKHLEDNYDDPYFQKWLSINFNAIYDAKKKYQLNRYVDRIAPAEQSQSYQRFLNFIWNLNLNEIKIIATYYGGVTGLN